MKLKNFQGKAEEIATLWKDKAEAILASDTASPADKKLAKDTLRYYMQGLSEANDDLTKIAVCMIANLFLPDVWNGSAVLTDVNGKLDIIYPPKEAA